MLKKNPEIVHGVLKMCRYVDVNIPSGSKIRSFANKTSSGFKVFISRIFFLFFSLYIVFYSTQTVMGFKNGTNDAFLQWFNESVELFRELTSNIAKDERRQLLDDPGKTIFLPHSLNFSSDLLLLHYTESTLTDHIVA